MKLYNPLTFWTLFAASLMLSMLIALLLPVTLDEAYYYLWGQKLAFGYFDHPPGVAFLASLSIGKDFIGPRFGTVLLGLATFSITWSFFRNLGLKDKKHIIPAMLLFKFSAAGIASGVLTVPDAPYLFFWILALHEAHAALEINPKRWLSAGFATGFGLLSKYTMLLIGPVFLTLLLLSSPKELKRPWPYLGGLLAFLILLPNLHWNSQNGWPSFSFQLRRLSIDQLELNPKFPAPLSHSRNTHIEEESPKAQEPQKIVKESSVDFSFSKPFHRFLEYLGGLFVLWGFLLFPLLFGFLRRKKDKEKNKLPKSSKIFLFTATTVPLITFGVLSFFTKIEANWSAIYMVSIIPLFYELLPHIRKGIILASSLNILVILLLAFHTRIPFLPLKSDRLLLETHGYQQLAKDLKNLDAPLFADTYQTVSMLRYYQGNQKAQQWPRINRPSQWTYFPEEDFSYEKILQKKSFWLLDKEDEFFEFPKFKIAEQRFIKDCKNDDNLLYLETKLEKPSCHHVHNWTLTKYILEDAFFERTD